MNKNKLIASQRVVIHDEMGIPSIKPACLLVCGEILTEVHLIGSQDYKRKIEELARRKKIDLEDFGDKIISPAFVNSHTHLPMTFFRSFSLEESTRGNMIENLFFRVESSLTAEDVEAFTRMGAYECLLNGIGFVWDHYYYGMAAAKGLKRAGLAGVIGPCLQDLSGPGTGRLEAQIQETIDIASSDELRSQGIFSALAPHATDTVSPQLWKRIARLSELFKVPVHAHVAQSWEEFERIAEREGCSPIRFLQRSGILESVNHLLAVHCIYASREDLKLLDPAHHALVFCPFSQLIFNFPAAVGEWERHGVRWALATDCVASNDSMNIQKEMRYVGGVPNSRTTHSEAFQRFLASGSLSEAKETSIFRLAQQDLSMKFSSSEFLLDKVWTSVGSWHPAVKVGAIAKGFLANIVVWDHEHPSFWPSRNALRPLAMGDTCAAIHNVMVVGKWIGKHGNFHRSVTNSAGYQSTREEASARFEGLVKRL